MGVKIIVLDLKGGDAEKSKVHETLVRNGARQVYEHFWVSDPETTNGSIYDAVKGQLSSDANSTVFVGEIDRHWSYSDANKPSGIKWLFDNHAKLFPS